MTRKKNDAQKYQRLSMPELLKSMYPKPTVDMPGPAIAPPNFIKESEDEDKPVFGLVLVACLIFLNSVINFGEIFIFEKNINFSEVSTISIVVSILNAVLAIGLLLRYESARLLSIMLNFMVLVVILTIMLVLNSNHIINMGDIDFATIVALAVPLVAVIALSHPSFKKQFGT